MRAPQREMLRLEHSERCSGEKDSCVTSGQVIAVSKALTVRPIAKILPVAFANIVHLCLHS